MSNFIEVTGYLHKINFDKEQIQSISSHSIPKGNSKEYSVRIFYKNREKPDIFEFNSEEDSIEFYKQLSMSCGDHWIVQSIRRAIYRIEEETLTIKNEIKKINKKLHRILSNKKESEK